MRTRNQDFILGLVVILFGVLFVGTLLWVYPRSGAAMRLIEIRFKADDGVSPIKEGSPVNLAGAMEVGKVVSVTRELKPPAGQRTAPELVIVVIARVEESLPLFTDCQITTEQPPIGGGGAVTISSIGTSNVPIVGSGPIEGQPPASLAAAISGLSRSLLGPGGLVEKLTNALDENQANSLMFKLSRSLTDINEMTDSLRVQLSVKDQKALVSKVHIIVDNLSNMTASLKDQALAENSAGMIARVHLTLDALSTALGEAKGMLTDNRPALQRTVAHVENVAQTLDEEVLAKLKRDFDRDDPTSLLGKLHEGMGHLHRSMEDIEAITETTRSLVIANRPLLQRTLENFKDVSDQMRVGIQELILQPWRLFQKPDAGEMKKLDVFEAARNFAEAATRLDDAVARLETILRETPADGTPRRSEQDVQMIRDSLKSAFERFRKAEEYLFEKMK